MQLTDRRGRVVGIDDGRVRSLRRCPERVLPLLWCLSRCCPQPVRAWALVAIDPPFLPAGLLRRRQLACALNTFLPGSQFAKFCVLSVLCGCSIVYVSNCLRESPSCGRGTKAGYIPIEASLLMSSRPAFRPLLAAANLFSQAFNSTRRAIERFKMFSACWTDIAVE